MDVKDGLPVKLCTTNPQSVGMQAPCLLRQQLSPVSNFNGEDLEGAFLDWAELIGDMCGWNDQAKLVNLTTHLHRQAYS